VQNKRMAGPHLGNSEWCFTRPGGLPPESHRAWCFTDEASVCRIPPVSFGLRRKATGAEHSRKCGA
jgi:hypothetical protein